MDRSIIITLTADDGGKNYFLNKLFENQYFYYVFTNTGGLRTSVYQQGHTIVKKVANFIMFIARLLIAIQQNHAIHENPQTGNVDVHAPHILTAL